MKATHFQSLNEEKEKKGKKRKENETKRILRLINSLFFFALHFYQLFFLGS